jgi:S-adenosylmethionine hydrolase
VLSFKGASLKLRPWLESIHPLEIPGPDFVVVLPDGALLRLTKAFGDVPEGSMTAYIGSSGLLEIAVNRGDASEITGLQRGQTIELKPQG